MFIALIIRHACRSSLWNVHYLSTHPCGIDITQYNSRSLCHVSLMNIHQRINGGILFPVGVDVTKWPAWLPASRWSWVRSNIKADLKNEPGLPGQHSQYLLKIRPPRWQENRLISSVLALGFLKLFFISLYRSVTCICCVLWYFELFGRRNFTFKTCMFK